MTEREQGKSEYHVHLRQLGLLDFFVLMPQYNYMRKNETIQGMIIILLWHSGLGVLRQVNSASSSQLKLLYNVLLHL